MKNVSCGLPINMSAPKGGYIESTARPTRRNICLQNDTQEMLHHCPNKTDLNLCIPEMRSICTRYVHAPLHSRPLEDAEKACSSVTSDWSSHARTRELELCYKECKLALGIARQFSGDDKFSRILDDVHFSQINLPRVT